MKIRFKSYHLPPVLLVLAGFVVAVTQGQQPPDLLGFIHPPPLCVPGAPNGDVGDDPLVVIQEQIDFLTGDLYYQSPHSTVQDIENLVPPLTGGLNMEILRNAYQPETVFVVGGSKGIGRAVACYWAEKEKTVISIATTDDLVPAVCPGTGGIFFDESLYIENHVYDISKSDDQNEESISEILDGREIDMLALIAGKDVMGALRDFDMQDMDRAYKNNVFGLHHVWKEVRNYLNPNFAQVIGASSVAAKTRLFGRRGAYHMTKQSLHDLVLGYAIEEALVNPETYYASVLHGDIKTEFGKNQILPKHVNDQCRKEFQTMGLFSNSFLQVNGVDPLDVADQYHSIFSFNNFIQVMLDMNPDATVPSGQPGVDDIPLRAIVPQSYKIEPSGTAYATDKLEFNHNLVPPGGTSSCYSQWWDPIAEYIHGGCVTPGGLLCDDYRFLAALIDPRYDQQSCSVVDDDEDDDAGDEDD